MAQRFIIFIIAFLFCHEISWAQDVIYKADQTEIQAKVLQVGKSEILYNTRIIVNKGKFVALYQPLVVGCF